MLLMVSAAGLTVKIVVKSETQPTHNATVATGGRR